MKYKIIVSCLIIYSFSHQLISQPADNISPFGINLNLERVGWLGGQVAKDSAVMLAENIGIRWSRETFCWNWFEVGCAQYNNNVFARYDGMVDLALAHGINHYGILTTDLYEQNWSLGDAAPSTQKHFQDYANFAKYLAEHYKDKIKHWEIWNGPDLAEYWPPAPNAYNYTQLLKDAYSAIKQVDSSIQVIGICLDGWGNEAYFKEVCSFGGLDYMDIVSIHPYGFWEEEARSTYERSIAFAAIDTFRSIMDQYGHGNKPIWVTEISFPTHKGLYGVSEDRQAIMLARCYLLFLAKGVEHISWYDFIDYTDSTYYWDNSGLLHFNRIPKPGYYAYQKLIQLLDDASFIEEKEIGSENKAMVFIKSNNKRVIAVWTYDEMWSNDTLISVNEKDVGFYIGGSVDSVFDIFGNSVNYSFQNDTLYIRLTNTPAYIIGDFPTSSGGKGPFCDKPLTNITFGISSNPLSTIKKLSYQLNSPCHVTLKIFNSKGSVVKTLEDAPNQAGEHTIVWNAQALPSGIYVCKLTAGKLQLARKSVFLQ